MKKISFLMFIPRIKCTGIRFSPTMMWMRTGDIYTVGYGADDSWQAMIDKMVASSMKDTGIHPTKEDKVVTLSTCSKAGETKRFVVHGVLVDVKTH